jgi:hypothetical protein
MDEQNIIDQLEELAEQFGVQIRYEPIKQDEDLVRVVGGLCLLRGAYVLIIDSKAAMRDKIRTFAEALGHFDLSRIYMKPAIRELLDKVPNSFCHGQAVIREENI